MDSGATAHLCNDVELFREFSGSNRGSLSLANHATTETMGEGTAHFATDTTGVRTEVSLNKTLHVLDLRTNLVSVSKITDRGFELHFRKGEAAILYKEGRLRLRAERIGDLYYVRELTTDASAALSSSGNNRVTLELLHRRMGHANTKDITDAVRNNRVDGVKLMSSQRNLDCDICLHGKMTRTPFPKKSNRKSELLDLVHTDVCGPMTTESIGRARYFVEFVDDHSKWCEVRFLRCKSEVFKATTDYLALAENQKGRTVKCIQSDNGREYTSREFEDYLAPNGAVQPRTEWHGREEEPYLPGRRSMPAGEVGATGHVLGRGREHRELPKKPIAHGELGRPNAVRSVDGEGTERLPPESIRQQGVLPVERARKGEAGTSRARGDFPRVRQRIESVPYLVPEEAESFHMSRREVPGGDESRASSRRCPAGAPPRHRTTPGSRRITTNGHRRRGRHFRLGRRRRGAVNDPRRS